MASIGNIGYLSLEGVKEKTDGFSNGWLVSNFNWYMLSGAYITTYWNNLVIITTSEEQYLRLLFTNPEMLDEQIINVHPYWIKDIKAPGEASEYSTVNAWMDILKIQALKYVLAVSECVAGADLKKSYDVYVQSVLINMPRRFINEEEKATIENTRVQLARHFEALKEGLGDRQATEDKIVEIYSNSPYAEKNQDSKYRVCAAQKGVVSEFSAT